MTTTRVSLDITELQSFQALTEPDKDVCLTSFMSEALEDKHRINKYFKWTAQIEQRLHVEELDNECFISFDVYPLNFRFCTIIFGLCGITNHFFSVLYMGIIEESKLDNPDQYICDLLTNIIIAEIPKLKSFQVKFVLCRGNPINERVLKLFAESKRTSKFYNTFPFICEPNELRNNEQLLDPYAQRACLEIMQGNIEQTSVKDIFHRYRQIAEEKGNNVLLQFVDNFFALARDLLDNRFEINLRLCTMDRMNNLENIIRAHSKLFDDEQLTRLFLFDLIRAVIHIYSF